MRRDRSGGGEAQVRSEARDEGHKPEARAAKSKGKSKGKSAKAACVAAMLRPPPEGPPAMTAPCPPSSSTAWRSRRSCATRSRAEIAQLVAAGRRAAVPRASCWSATIRRALLHQGQAPRVRARRHDVAGAQSRRERRRRKKSSSSSQALNRDDARRRHPGAAAAAEAACGREPVIDGDRPRQGRRRPAPDQRRAPAARACPASRPARRSASSKCSTARGRARGRERGGDRPQRARRQADRAAAARAPRHRDDLPLAHARPRAVVREADVLVAAAGSAAAGEGRLDQPGRGRRSTSA